VGIGAFGITRKRSNKLALPRLPHETNPEIIHVFEELFVANIDLIRGTAAPWRAVFQEPNRWLAVVWEY
jgi:hypothetical protein